MNNVIKIPKQADGSHERMGRIENFFAALNQRDVENGISRRQKVVRGLAGGIMALAGISYVGNALQLPDTHSNGIGLVANPDVDLKKQGTSGDKDFDVAINLVNQGIANAKEQGVLVSVGQKEREKLAEMVTPVVAQLDTNPNPNIFDVDQTKYDFIVPIENGIAQQPKFIDESKQ